MPWTEMYLLRKKISHEYFGVDIEIIWDLATNCLPEITQQIMDILDNEELK